MTDTDEGYTWYLKWIGTVLIVLGAALRSAGGLEFPDLIVSFIGAVCWGINALYTHNRALLVTNAVIIVFLVGGIARHIST